jgi:hypothetical protein
LSNEVNYWTEQAVLNFFDYRRAMHMICCFEEGMGTTTNELVNLAMGETVHLLKDETGWSEEAIRHSIETYIQNLRARDEQARSQ